jgi:hypothetical protein
MRRQSGVLVFVGCLGVLASSAAAGTRPAADESRAEATVAPVAVQRVSIPPPGLRDEAAMVIVGTALIGLAAAVRRAA